MNGVNGRPIKRITVDITNKCNLRCVMCPQHTMAGERYDMPLEVYRNLVPALSLTRELFFSCAFEALMSSSFAGILDLTRAAAVPEWVLITNATLLDEKAAALIIDAGISTVVISMDGATPGTYERIRRGADFERTLGNIARFNEIKRMKGAKKPDLNLTCTLMRSNIHEMPGLVRLARSLDIPRVNIKPLQVLLPEMRGEGLLPSDAEAVAGSLNDARRAGEDLGVTVTVAPELGPVAGPRTGHENAAPGTKRCIEPFPSMYVRPGGEVYPCTVWRQEPVGDLRRQNFDEIWNGDDFVSLRDELTSGEFRDSCRSCVYAL